MPSTIIIGAGMAGLSCAGVLSAAGHQVTLVDKARGPGGRCSTRRNEPWLFDHGAQYFTAKSPSFTDQVARWERAGQVAVWNGRFVSINNAGVASPLIGQPPRYVGAPGMNEMARAMLADHDLRRATRIVEAGRSGGQWDLLAESGERLACDNLVVTAPPVQTLALVGGVSDPVREQVERVSMVPCWALMLGFEADVGSELDPGFDGAFVADSPIGWIARSDSRPGRQTSPGWVVHGSDDFSQEYLEASAEDVANRLLAEFQTVTAITTAPAVAVAHRWRYAKAVDPLAEGFIADQGSRLWVAGDWCAGSRVEGAWLSGQAAAQHLLKSQR
ncbi:MAG: NAD(P)/FAD-dependent oxidoreductase [Lysobacterales bacterium]